MKLSTIILLLILFAPVGYIPTNQLPPDHPIRGDMMADLSPQALKLLRSDVPESQWPRRVRHEVRSWALRWLGPDWASGPDEWED